MFMILYTVYCIIRYNITACVVVRYGKKRYSYLSSTLTLTLEYEREEVLSYYAGSQRFIMLPGRCL